MASKEKESARLEKRNLFIAFLAILLLGFALRAYHLDWGLPNTDHPYSYHPDEARLIQYMAGIHPEKLDFNPDDMAYPTMHIMINGAVMLAMSKLGVITVSSDPLFYAGHPEEFAKIIFIGRMIGLIFSMMTIILVYLITRELHNKKAAIAAMLLYALIPLDVIESHYFALDTPMVMWMMLALYGAVMTYKDADWRWYLLSGAAVGFAGSTKYPGFFSGIFLVIAHLWRSAKYSETWKETILSLFRRRMIVFFSAIIIAFIIGTPYSLLEPATFFGNFIKTYQVSSGNQMSIPTGYNMGLASWGYGYLNYPLIHQILVMLPMALGFALFGYLVFSIVEISRYAENKIRWMLLCPSALYLLIVFRWVNVFPRYLYPLMPLAAIICAIGYRQTIKHSKTNAPAIIFMAICAFTLVFSVSLDLKFNDTQEDAYDWVFKNVPSGSKMAVTLWGPLRYTPLKDPDVWVNGTMQNSVIIEKRQNLVNASDGTHYGICRGEICKEYVTYTMFNPTTEWFDARDPDYVILSSLVTNGIDSPVNDTSTDMERSFYSRFTGCTSGYYEVARFDKPYVLSWLHELFDPRLESMYASPRITVYKKA